MKKMRFWNKLGLSFQPWEYKKVEELHGWGITKYFLILVLLMFMVCTIIFVPIFYSDVMSQMDNFDKLTINIDKEMSRPVMLPKSNPILSIDTRENHIKPGNENVLMTDDYFYVKKPLFLGAEKIKSGDFKNLLENQGLVAALLLLMLPTLLFLFYLYYLIKSFVLIFIVAFLALIITRLAKFDITFANLMKIGLLGATPMVILDFLLLPFGLFIFYGQIVLFVLFMIIGIIKTGEFRNRMGDEDEPRPRRARKKKLKKIVKMR